MKISKLIWWVFFSGNIRVFCRVRPVIKEDGSGAQAESVVSYDEDDDGLVNVQYKGRPQTFDLDKVFNASISQQDVSVFNYGMYY